MSLILKRDSARAVCLAAHLLPKLRFRDSALNHHHNGTANVNNELLENDICPMESRITIPEQLSHPVALRTEKLLASGKEDHKSHTAEKGRLLARSRFARSNEPCITDLECLVTAR